jgi:hypothetical protein
LVGPGNGLLQQPLEGLGLGLRGSARSGQLLPVVHAPGAGLHVLGEHVFQAHRLLRGRRLPRQQLRGGFRRGLRAVFFGQSCKVFVSVDIIQPAKLKPRNVHQAATSVLVPVAGVVRWVGNGVAVEPHPVNVGLRHAGRRQLLRCYALLIEPSDLLRRASY